MKQLPSYSYKNCLYKEEFHSIIDQKVVFCVTMDANIENALIKKETIYGGTKAINFVPGTRVSFHFQTQKLSPNNEVIIIDDSRKFYGKPMELVLGKKFKLEVWEVIVQKLALNEVAKFTVDKSLVPEYPFVSKTLRDSHKPHEDRHHCCGMTLQNEGIGYKDLDELFHNPTDLIFIFELLSVELPDEYEKDTWQLNDDEKLQSATDLKECGNKYYNEKKYDLAEETYSKGIAIIEQLMLKEKPNDVEWNDLAKIKVPLLLNFSQCKLIAKDYYNVIELCTEILKYDENNIKALYRRGKAHIGAWNVTNAKNDLNLCLKLDKKNEKMINKELDNLDELIKLNDIQDKLKYQNLFD